MERHIDIPLIKGEGYEGYESLALLRWMKKHHLDKEFKNFIHGSTGAITERSGKQIFIIYRWDVDKFLAGGHNTD